MDYKIAFVFYPVFVFGIIHNNNELYCDLEEQFCAGWRNESAVPNDRRVAWRTAKTGVVLDAWHSIPRPDEGDHFAFVLGSAGQEPDVAWLVSDTIPCLLVPGILTFSYWKNAFLSGLLPSVLPRLKVLIRQPPTALNPKLLFDVGPYNAVGWRYADVYIPSVDKPFKLVIQAEVQGAFDLVAIDQIMFRGYIDEKHCHLSAPERERLLQSGFYEQVMESIRTSRRQAPYSSDSHITWPQPTDLPFLPSFGSYGGTRQPLNAGGNLVLPVIDAPAEELSKAVPFPTQELTTRAPYIERLIGQAAQSPNNRLIQERVRVSRPITSISDALAAALRSQPLFLTDSSPPSNDQQPFFFDTTTERHTTERYTTDALTTTALTTTVFQPPLADVGDSTPTSTYMPTKFRDVDTCEAVNCDFEGSTCDFEGTQSNDGAWTVVQGRVGNALTGITRAAFGRYYVVAYRNRANVNDTQVLRSRPFRTSTTATVSFWYFKSPSPGVRLLVCNAVLDNCLWERKTDFAEPKRRATWQYGSVVLPAGHHQIMFVVENLNANEFVAVDEISLRQIHDGPLAHCQMEI